MGGLTTFSTFSYKAFTLRTVIRYTHQVTVHRGGHQISNNRRTVTVQQHRRFGQAARRCVPRVRKPGRSSEDVVLLNGYLTNMKMNNLQGGR